MESILHTIAKRTKQRIVEEEKKIPLAKVKEAALSKECNMDFPFEKAIKTKKMSFICECKKASPSKGLISADFPYLKIAQEYEQAGAACVSVLTEPFWFLGNDKYLNEIANTIKIPCLRKDFTVDEYMIYTAKNLGASAILLICSLLDTNILKKYISICDSLGISALVEVHDEEEIRSALSANARIIGVNNRNLKDFTVDINNSRKLRKFVPDDILFVAESGIKTAEDVFLLHEYGVNAVLIGETLMRAENKKSELQKLRGNL
jgi:indole-3-glycerol phosphate synthase